MQSNLSGTPPRFILGRISGGSVYGRCPLCLPGNVAMFVRTINELKRRLMSQESGAQTPICSASHSFCQPNPNEPGHTQTTYTYRYLDRHIMQPDLPAFDLNLLLQAHTASGDICQETDCKTCILDDAETEHACMQVCVWCKDICILKSQMLHHLLTNIMNYVLVAT